MFIKLGWSVVFSLEAYLFSTIKQNVQLGVTLGGVE